MLKRPKNGFTLMEIMTVIVILGMVMAFALPNYNKTLIHTQKQEAINNLKLIHAAEQIYFSRIGSNYPPFGLTVGLDQINDNLNIDIIANDLTYSCQAMIVLSCTAIRTASPAFTVTLVVANPISTTNPSCTGYCP